MPSHYLNLDQLIQSCLSQPDDETYVSKTILDSIADGVISLDLERNITSFNRAAEHITGYTRQDVIGRKCYDVFKSESCDQACPALESMATGEPITNRRIDIIDCFGNKLPVSTAASALRDAMGQLVGAVETFRDLSASTRLQEELRKRSCLGGIYSRNPAMHDLFKIIPDIAASEATVLVNGESGTGKELFAKALHDLSPRKDGPLVIINCGALPEPLLEAEIFGAKRGAYTGAIEDRQGRLELAEGGTLFLDEIGDLPLSLQVKLLRVLENHEYQPLGGKTLKKANVRFIAATHRNIEKMVQEGTFRRDLYYRINVIGFTIPPLRDRKEDIPLLADLFIAQLNEGYGKQVVGLAPDATKKLLDHDFPGNVRELQNIIEQIVILCHQGEITLEMLPEYLMQKSERFDERKRHGCPSADELQEILNRFDGNKQRTAQAFGVDRTTLWRWMKRRNLLDK